ncbi:MAG: MFS transporter [Anaerolineae bacterium]
MITTTTTRNMVNRTPFYYGWIVLIVATIGIVATAPGQSFTVSLFIDYFIEEFNMTRTTVSALYSGGTFLASLSLTFVGRLIDRYGNRAMTVAIVSAFALTLVLFSFITGPISLFFGFLGIRMFGQGALGLVNNTVIVEWFKRLRGRVMSIVFVTFALFQWAYVPWLQLQLELYGWRTMAMVLGASVAVVVIPLAWLFMRNTPEEFGLLPDGENQDNARLEDLDFMVNSWTLKEVLGNITFWVFVLGRIISPAWGTGLIFHQVSIFSEQGHDAATAAANYGLIMIVTAIGSLVFGMLVDRLHARFIMTIQLLALIAAMVLATMMTNDIFLWFYALAFGIMMSGGSAFDGTVWVNLFGRGHQGAIRGFVSTTMVLGTALGPVLFGISLDFAGSYTPVLMIGVGLAILGVIGALFSPTPKKRKRKLV